VAREVVESVAHSTLLVLSIQMNLFKVIIKEMAILIMLLAHPAAKIKAKFKNYTDKQIIKVI
jgi:hypothetical protein